MRREIVWYEETDSTNLRVKACAKQGAEEGLVVVADRQTAGRGRSGRIWDSSSDENLYLSLLLRPRLEVEKAPMLTLVMAMSVVEAIRNQIGLPVQIKWPNDLVSGGRKLAGILTEMQLQGEDIAYVTVGVGVNVNQGRFSEALEHMATSLYLEHGERVERESLLYAILDAFATNYEQFLAEGSFAPWKARYEALLVNKDREVRVLAPKEVYQGKALGINDEGGLLIQTENGDVRTVFSGEVSVRGIYGYV